MLTRRFSILFLATLFAACAPPESSPAGSLGKADTIGQGAEPSVYSPGNRYGWGGEDRFLDEVQPILAERCVTCHGCTDAPCQLKLSSFEGINRGSSEVNVFATRVTDAPAVHMSTHRELDEWGRVDYEASRGEWRKNGYYSVTEGGENSLMHQLLQHAHDNPAITRDLTPAYELSEEILAGRTFQCIGPDAQPTPEELAARAMPFGAEQLTDEQYTILTEWLQDGAPGPDAHAQDQLAQPANPQVVARWEEFLNRDSDKGQLVSRYLFEHLFFAHLHFDEAPGEFYEIVRSFTPPGEPIEEITTELAHDSPDNRSTFIGTREWLFGTTRVYYRLRKYTPVVVRKTHIPWLLSDSVMNRWQELFFDVDYEVDDLPGYSSDNPFSNFDQIPSESRAHFMIENSLALIDAMVKGDVCTGSTATYAIRDRFWVWFLDPSADPSAQDPRLGNSTYLHLNPGGFDLEGSYQESFEEQLREMHPDGLSMDDIWDADNGENPNGWITVMRHARNTTAHHGAIGGRPESLWVLSYSNFERLYYNLVVNFKVWGSAVHGLETWRYMSRIRTEGEDLWLSLLPEEERVATRAQWTRDYDDRTLWNPIQRITEGGMYSEGRATQIETTTEDPVGELISLGIDHLGPIVTRLPDSLNPNTDPHAQSTEETLPEQIQTFADFEQALRALANWRGPHAALLPEVTVLRVRDGEGFTRYYSLIAHRGYRNHDLTLAEERARDTEQDVLSAVPGIVGNYPNLFVEIKLEGAMDIVTAMSEMETDEDWRAIVRNRADPTADVFFIQRSDPEFWPFLNDLHTQIATTEPITAGILDISEYVWPQRFE